ncbi:PP2C family protein-serine/threonine phosphatase [Nocardioides acrostichi]|uniref:Serine/threonine-protein phosphatase n=1 Tax=Nocardioides acrostichi TaxID=2784339 RepID=A0A930UTR4_9ACTN|nr:PP2C family protein-serine/threonine phosphatase [Nocardioides acrostichi]MBF4160683.1 serine/threonine-protein phosphatase [Nocardioides acrostichi]
MSARPWVPAGGWAAGTYPLVEWERTPLGRPDTWPAELTAALDLVLSTRFVAALIWGEEHTVLYNQAFAQLLEPGQGQVALGNPGPEILGEAWGVIRPAVEEALTTCEGTWTEDEHIRLRRSEIIENCWFTFSCSPVCSESREGAPRGVALIASETTRQVLRRSRDHDLARISASLSDFTARDDLTELVPQVVMEGGHLLKVALAPGLTDDSRSPEAGEGVALAIAVPLKHPEAGRWHLVARTDPHTRLDADYHAYADAVGAAVGVALDSQAAHASERQLSEALQRSLLSRPAAGLGLEVAVRYHPASNVARVGGDWYDAYPMPDGAIAVMVGDVAGHDQDAAAAMAQLRNLARGVAFAGRLSLPSEVLRDLDHAMDSLGVDEMATAVMAVLEEAGPDGHLVHWANAGHPPPVLLRRDGRTELLEDTPDVLLGVDPAMRRRDHRVELAPGDLVLLYTDGLVERRDQDIDVGLRWLTGIVSSLAGIGPDELCDRVLAAASAQAYAHDDDIVLLAVRGSTG